MNAGKVIFKLKGFFVGFVSKIHITFKRKRVNIPNRINSVGVTFVIRPITSNTSNKYKCNNYSFHNAKLY